MFIDTIEPGKELKTTLQTTFDDVNLDEELTDKNGFFKTLTVTGRGNLDRDVVTRELPGMHGVVELSDPTLTSREITVKFLFSAKTNEKFRKRIDELKNLVYRPQKPLRFTDEDYFYRATLTELEVPEEEKNILVCNLHFLCSDPFKYGEEERSVIKTADGSDSTIVTLFAGQADGFEYNPSTVEAQPIFEVEFKDNTDEFTIEHKESKRHLTVVYDFEEGDKLTLDATNRRVQINGETRMQTLALSSEWFNLVSRGNAFDITDGANVTLRYRARLL